MFSLILWQCASKTRRLDCLGTQGMTGESTPSTESLEDLRGAIDRIDDALLDLLTERAALGARIAAAKRAAQDAGSYGGVVLRPGREMEILRRLIGRAEGPFPKPVIIRMWRELFAALISLQGAMSMAVYMPTRGAGYLELARNHYGSQTPATTWQTTAPVVRAVAEGEVSVGILPLPRFEEPAPWWPMLFFETPNTPRIISRLPLCGPGAGRGDGVEAMAIGRMPLEATGHDRGLVAIETAADISRGGIRALVESSGLPLLEIIDSYAPSEERRQYLVEVSEYVAADDPRVAKLAADPQIGRAVVVGVYAVPFSAEELSSPVQPNTAP